MIRIRDTLGSYYEPGALFERAVVSLDSDNVVSVSIPKELSEDQILGEGEDRIDWIL